MWTMPMEWCRGIHACVLPHSLCTLTLCFSYLRLHVLSVQLATSLELPLPVQLSRLVLWVPPWRLLLLLLLPHARLFL